MQKQCLLITYISKDNMYFFYICFDITLDPKTTSAYGYSLCIPFSLLAYIGKKDNIHVLNNDMNFINRHYYFH